MDEAMPDWKRFGSKIKGRFSTVKHPDFLKALEYLLKNPPRTQMRSSENTVRWVNTPRWRHEANEAYLLRLVRTVRNNLFHGGKYPQEDGGEVKDEGRNERFLEAGLTILSQCLLSYPALEVRFAEAA